MLTIERCHIKAALRGIARQLGEDLPTLDHLTYNELVDRYRDVIAGHRCIQFKSEEIQEMYQEELIRV